MERGDRATLAIKIIREILQLSLSDALRLKKKIPGQVLTGTKAEMYRLKPILEVRNIPYLASKIES